MIPLMVAFPLLFAFLIAVLDSLRMRRNLLRILFIIGATLPACVFLIETGREVVGGWTKEAGVEVWIGEINTPFIVGELILFITVAFYVLFHVDIRERKTPKVFVLFLLMHAGLLGAFISRDLFNFYIYMEIASVAAFTAVAFSEEAGSKRAAFKYLILSLLASYIFILAVGIIYMETGYLNVDLIAENASKSRELKVALGLALSALLLKAGVFPLHGWLPDAHSSAPTPASAMLSGAVVKAPAYGTILIFSALPVSEGIRLLTIGLAATSILFGVGMALLQRDAKRLLAYHTVSQMGYVLLGVASFNFLGAAYYAMAHSLFKGGLFLSVGSLGKRSRKLGEFGYRRAPFMVISVLMLSLAIGGISPFVGAYAKGILYLNLPSSWKWVIPAGTVGTLISFTKLNYYLSKVDSERLEASAAIPSVTLALITLLAGLYLGSSPKLRDSVYVILALLLFVLLKKIGVFDLNVKTKRKNIGEDINLSVSLFILMAILLSLTASGTLP